MKLTVENTDKIVTLVVNGGEVPARIWQGFLETPDGPIPVHLHVTRIAVQEGRPESDYAHFVAELKQTAKMRPEIQTIPLRLIL